MHEQVEKTWDVSLKNVKGMAFNKPGTVASTESHFGFFFLFLKAASLGRRDRVEGFRCVSLLALRLCPRSL